MNNKVICYLEKERFAKLGVVLADAQKHVSEILLTNTLDREQFLKKVAALHITIGLMLNKGDIDLKTLEDCIKDMATSDKNASIEERGSLVGGYLQVVK